MVSPLPTRTLTLAALLSLSLLLSACGDSYGPAPKLPTEQVPKRLRVCFKQVTGLPSPKGGWSLEQAYRIIGDLGIDNKAKSRCGRDLLAWIDRIQAGLR